VGLVKEIQSARNEVVKFEIEKDYLESEFIYSEKDIKDMARRFTHVIKEENKRFDVKIKELECRFKKMIQEVEDAFKDRYRLDI